MSCTLYIQNIDFEGNQLIKTLPVNDEFYAEFFGSNRIISERAREDRYENYERSQC